MTQMYTLRGSVWSLFFHEGAVTITKGNESITTSIANLKDLEYLIHRYFNDYTSW